MDGHIPLLRGSLPTEESSGPSVVDETVVASVHHAASLAQCPRGPHTADQGRGTRPRQPQLQEDEEDTNG